MNTEAEELQADDPLSRLRAAYAKLHFAMQGIWERSKQLWAAMHGDPERGPVDYDEREDTTRLLIDIIRKQANTAGGGNYNEGDSGTKAVVIGVGIALLSAFILGGWVLSNKVAGLEATVTEWKAAAQRQIDANTQRIDRLENRRP